MNVVPKQQGGALLIVPAKDHFVMECVATAPPSSKGRTVYLVLDSEHVTRVLLALREDAIAARSTPMTAAVGGRQ